MPRLQPGLHWVGPLSIVGTVVVSWFAFEGARGKNGGVALGLWLGSASILLMAWSFLLAVRLSRLEPFFGGEHNAADRPAGHDAPAAFAG